MSVRAGSLDPRPIERWPALRADLATVRALVRRAANELLRVPGAAIPGVLAPTIFFAGLTAVFGGLTALRGFDTDTYQSFVIPISLLQGAGFTGAAAGVMLAGIVVSASLRSLIPATFLLAIGFAIGVGWPGLDGLLLALAFVMATGAVAACWGVMIALRFRSQSAAPLMQAGMFVLVLTTTAYAPLELLQGWLADIARINPLTQVVEAIRSGFVTGAVDWTDAAQGAVAVVALVAILGAVALAELYRSGRR